MTPEQQALISRLIAQLDVTRIRLAHAFRHNDPGLAREVCERGAGGLTDALAIFLATFDKSCKRIRMGYCLECRRHAAVCRHVLCEECYSKEVEHDTV